MVFSKRTRADVSVSELRNKRGVEPLPAEETLAELIAAVASFYGIPLSQHLQAEGESN